VFVRNGIFAGIGISCLDLNDEAFGKAFNIKPVAIFNLLEPSNTCKALREMFLDFKTAGEYGILLFHGTGRDDDVYIHEAFNFAMCCEFFLLLSKLMLLLLSFPSLVIVCDVGVASTTDDDDAIAFVAVLAVVDVVAVVAIVIVVVVAAALVLLLLRLLLVLLPLLMLRLVLFLGVMLLL